MRYVVLFLIYLGILKRLPTCSFIACLQRAACEEAHDALPERAARRRIGRRASPVLGRRDLGMRTLGMRVAPRGHSVPLQLDVDHLADGVEQLHAVFRELPRLGGSPPLFRLYLSFCPVHRAYVFDSANTFAIGRKGDLSPALPRVAESAAKSPFASGRKGGLSPALPRVAEPAAKLPFAIGRKGGLSPALPHVAESAAKIRVKFGNGTMLIGQKTILIGHFMLVTC